MQGYETLSGFEHLYLEDSWVLGVVENAHEVRFDVEAVLTEDHPEWQPRKRGEAYTYKRVSIVFRRPREVQWIARASGEPAVDASGEVDYGNIDAFTWEGSHFELEGDWGRTRLEGDPPVVIAAQDVG